MDSIRARVTSPLRAPQRLSLPRSSPAEEYAPGPPRDQGQTIGAGEGTGGVEGTGPLPREYNNPSRAQTLCATRQRSSLFQGDPAMRRRLPRPTLFVAAILLFCAPAFAQSTKGHASDMPAYYDGKLFTINFMELSPDAERSAIAHNSAINKIFRSDPGLPGGQPFISVLDAIQGDGFNPLCREFQITFNSGHTPRQLTSDNEVAAAVQRGEITLQATDKVYICSVVGSKR